MYNTYIRENDSLAYTEGDYMEFRVLSCQNSHGVFFLEGTL